MIKEVILAIILGALLGFGVTGGYLALQSKNNPKTNNQVIIEPTLIPTTTETKNDNTSSTQTPALNITSPQKDSLVSSDKVTITGTTSANNQIIITTATQNFIGQSDKDGQFSIPIKIESGLNTVKISAIDKDDNQLDSQINITYSSAKI